MRFDHIASNIVNANHGIRSSAAVLGVSDSVRDGSWSGMPQPTEWQRIGDYIDTAFIFARTDFVSVHQFSFS